MDKLLDLAPLLVSAAIYFFIIVRMRNQHEKGLALLSNEQRGQLIQDLKPVRSLTMYLLLGVIAIYIIAMSATKSGFSYGYFLLYMILVLGVQIPIGFYQKRLLAQKGYDADYLELSGKLVWMRLMAIGILALGAISNAFYLGIDLF
ncbi:MAG: hypothetical protein ACO3DK_02520 [Bacteroidia bacterium]